MSHQRYRHLTNTYKIEAAQKKLTQPPDVYLESTLTQIYA